MRIFDRWDWNNASAFIVVLTTLFGVLIWVGRALMSRSFVSHKEHAELSARTKGLELRLTPVETGVAVLGVQVQSVKEGVQRTEHMVSMLLEHQLKGETVS